ncbi:unnamed protein product [Calicophoron daubneyi]|uniref:UPF0506 domain-containing protein n=1 Tax=Calicophoron daubneyi TaxID=300641 RepID=A0AAV2TRF1_CALDB
MQTMAKLAALIVFTFLVTFICYDTASACGSKDEYCDGSLFYRCCGDMKCQLSGFASGVCKECIENEYPCALNSHCCSGLCRRFKCVDARKLD